MKNRKTIMITMSIIAFMWIMHTVSKNFMVDPQFTSFLSNKVAELPNENIWIVMIRIHIILAIIALITGPIGLSRTIRKKRPSVHCWNGRLYVATILLNMIPGYYVSFFANGGLWSIIGFFILNTLWLITTWNGYRTIRMKKVMVHRKWMIRSFFLTFANLTIYIVVTIFHHGLNFEYGISYSIAVWSACILNLILAEFVIRKTKI